MNECIDPIDDIDHLAPTFVVWIEAVRILPFLLPFHSLYHEIAKKSRKLMRGTDEIFRLRFRRPCEAPSPCQKNFYFFKKIFIYTDFVTPL